MTISVPNPRDLSARTLSVRRNAAAGDPARGNRPVVSVLASTVPVEDGYGWCLKDTECATLAEGREATLGEAEFAVVSTLLTHADLMGALVYVGGSDALLRILREHRALLPSVECCPSGHLIWSSVWRQTVLAAEAAGKPHGPLVVASDGSRGKRREACGWGWVAADGTYGYGGLVGVPAKDAEIAAIANAIKGTRHRSEVIILSDSRQAVAVTCAVLRGSVVSGTHWRSAEVLREGARGRTVRVEWVKGHAGHALNEGADRLAVLANRVNRGMLEQVDATARQIAHDAATAFRAQQRNNPRPSAA